MDADLWSEVKDTLDYRQDWERKQKTWYNMRYTGIKRAAPPYPNAPDMHYPLADTMIEKQKPYYISQIYSQERLATFVSGMIDGKPQPSSLAVQAERAFDYHVKQYTNFERSSHTFIDYMLMYGRGPVKIILDPGSDTIKFIPIRAVYVIVPTYTENMQEADWLVHVVHMSPRQYKAKGKDIYPNQDQKFIDSITGQGDDNRSQMQEFDIKQREGITYGEKNQIVLWEVYRRTGSQKDGYKVKMEAISPMLGPSVSVRKEYTLPYKHNEIPICDLRYELADLDYYGSRGTTEIVAPFEMDLNKMWNHKLQFLDFAGQPQYKNEGISPNPPNFKNRPGIILPPGVEPTESSSAPLDFEKEMQLQRSLAEDRLQVPDLSAGQHLSGTRGAKGEVTATQINAITGQAGQGNDYRGRTFRLQLGAVFNQAWSLMIQYKKDDIMVLDDFSEVPPEALHDQYKIHPSGSADSFDKNQRMQRALMYYQTLGTAPGMKTAEIAKWVWEQDDPALVRRFYEEPQDQSMDQITRQGVELASMQEGFPARVRTDDVDYIHIAAIAQWLQNAQQNQKQITPQTAQLVEQHLQQHGQAAQLKKDKQGVMMLQQYAPIFAGLVQIAMQGQQQQAQPGAPDGSGQVPQAQQEGGQGQPGPTPEQEANDKMKAASAMMASMAAATKAGVPLTNADYSALLISVGLPPMANNPMSRKPIVGVDMAGTAVDASHKQSQIAIQADSAETDAKLKEKQIEHQAAAAKTAAKQKAQQAPKKE